MSWVKKLAIMKSLILSCLLVFAVMSLVAQTPENTATDSLLIAEKEPIPLNLPEVVQSIGYPTAAKLNEIQGTVILRVLVDKTGKYEAHEVVQEVHPSLRKKVEKKIKLLKFSPAMVNGEAARFWATIPFHFYLVPPGKKKN